MPDQPRAPPAPEALRAYAEGFNRSLTLRHFGATLEFPSAELIRATLQVQPAQRGGMGDGALVNGAVIAGLFDLVVGCTGALVDPLRRSATLQLSMSFERPVDGDTITCEGWVDRAGSRMLFSSAVVRNAAGVVCARCQGVVRITTLPWADEASPAVPPK
jgi:acyl-coenzyme A thioesterase PaaI-like protein